MSEAVGNMHTKTKMHFLYINKYHSYFLIGDMSMYKIWLCWKIGTPIIYVRVLRKSIFRLSLGCHNYLLPVRNDHKIRPLTLFFYWTQISVTLQCPVQLKKKPSFHIRDVYVFLMLTIEKTFRQIGLLKIANPNMQWNPRM